MSLEFSKEECVHALMAVNIFSFPKECEICDSVALKLRAEIVRLYDVPEETVLLLDVPEAYKLLGVTKWEKVVHGKKETEEGGDSPAGDSGGDRASLSDFG